MSYITEIFVFLGNLYICQTLAVEKGIGADAGDTGGDGNAGQGNAGLERTVADGLQPRPQGDARQALAVVKGIAADGGDTVRDGNARQGSFVGERPVSNSRYRQATQSGRNGDISTSPGVAGDGDSGAIGVEGIVEILAFNHRLLKHRAGAGNVLATATIAGHQAVVACR